MGRKESKAAQREKGRQEMAENVDLRRKQRTGSKWGEKSCVEHHCPICQSPLFKIPNKTLCIRKGHVAPCPAFHEALIRTSDIGCCTACRQELSLHEKRHQEILEKIKSLASELDEEDGGGPSSLGPSQKSAKSKALDTPRRPVRHKPFATPTSTRAHGFDMQSLALLLHPAHHTKEQKLGAAKHDTSRIMSDVESRLQLLPSNNNKVGAPVSKAVANMHAKLEQMVKADLEAEAARLIEADRQLGRYCESEFYVKEMAMRTFDKDGGSDGGEPDATPGAKRKRKHNPTRPSAAAAAATAVKKPDPKYVAPTARREGSDVVEIVLSGSVKRFRLPAPVSAMVPGKTPSQQSPGESAKTLDGSTSVRSRGWKSKQLATECTTTSVKEVGDKETTGVTTDRVEGVAGEELAPEATITEGPVVTKPMSKSAAKRAARKANKAAKREADADEDALLATQLAEKVRIAEEAASKEAKERQRLDKLELEVANWTYEQALSALNRYEPGGGGGGGGGGDLFKDLGDCERAIRQPNWTCYHCLANEGFGGTRERRFTYAWLALLGHGLFRATRRPGAFATFACAVPFDGLHAFCDAAAAHAAWVAGWSADDYFSAEEPDDDVGGKLCQYTEHIDRELGGLLRLYSKLPATGHGEEAFLARKLILWRVGVWFEKMVREHPRDKRYDLELYLWNVVGDKYASPRYRHFGRDAGLHMRAEWDKIATEAGSFGTMIEFRCGCGGR